MKHWTHGIEKERRLLTLFWMNTFRILTGPPAVMNKVLLLRLCRHSRQLSDAAHPNRAQNCSESSSAKEGFRLGRYNDNSVSYDCMVTTTKNAAQTEQNASSSHNLRHTIRTRKSGHDPLFGNTEKPPLRKLQMLLFTYLARCVVPRDIVIPSRKFNFLHQTIPV